MKDKTSNRGGSRPGAGRPVGSLNRKPKLERTKLQIVLPSEIVAALEARSRADFLPKSSIVCQALKAYLDL